MEFLNFNTGLCASFYKTKVIYNRDRDCTLIQFLTFISHIVLTKAECQVLFE